MSDTVARVEASWQTLLDTIRGVPEERLSEPGAAGEWSIKDLLGHIAFWAAVDASRAERLAQGLPPLEPGEDDGDYETVNQREVARRKDWSLVELWGELEGSHAAMVAALRAADEAGVTVPVEGSGCYDEHYDEHVADIRAWRERRGI